MADPEMLTPAQVRDWLAEKAAQERQWAGLPCPHPDIPMVTADRPEYEIFERPINEPAKRPARPEDSWPVVGRFELRRNPGMFCVTLRNPEGKVKGFVTSNYTMPEMLVNTINVSAMWSLRAERKAQRKLFTLISRRATSSTTTRWPGHLSSKASGARSTTSFGGCGRPSRSHLRANMSWRHCACIPLVTTVRAGPAH